VTYDPAQAVRDLLLLLAGAGGIIKVAEFIVSRRHLAIRTLAGYWNDPDGTTGTMLHVEIHNQGRRVSLDYVSFILGSSPPNWWRRRIRRFDSREAEGFGVTVAQYTSPPKWLDAGEFLRVESRLEGIAARSVGIRKQMRDERPLPELMRTMHAQVKCGEGHEHIATFNANSRANIERFAKDLPK
jgi:hypothetical protein